VKIPVVSQPNNSEVKNQTLYFTPSEEKGREERKREKKKEK
jgi:hypothetical protein